jgi:NTP pyrophosphatase (non-canonical NTP hydrolase)
MNNPLAFPNPNRTDQTGMTLRDYFATKAMQAIMGDRKEQNYWGEAYGIEEMMQFTAERAYEQADAMLKEREAKHKENT